MCGNACAARPPLTRVRAQAALQQMRAGAIATLTTPLPFLGPDPSGRMERVPVTVRLEVAARLPGQPAQKVFSPPLATQRHTLIREVRPDTTAPSAPCCVLCSRAGSTHAAQHTPCRLRQPGHPPPPRLWCQPMPCTGTHHSTCLLGHHALCMHVFPVTTTRRCVRRSPAAFPSISTASSRHACALACAPNRRTHQGADPGSGEHPSGCCEQRHAYVACER